MPPSCDICHQPLPEHALWTSQRYHRTYHTGYRFLQPIGQIRLCTGCLTSDKWLDIVTDGTW